MRILVIGGTGFIGSYICNEFIKEEHRVRVFAKESNPEVESFLDGAEFYWGDLFKIPDNEYLKLLADCDAVVFAAGVDDRKLTKLPPEEFFHLGNVSSSQRLIQLALQAGISKFLFIGSYFTHFDRIWKELNLSQQHPYIRSRKEQIETVKASLPPSVDCAFLELPFVFGKVYGGTSLWVPLMNYLRSSWPIIAPKGGTAVVSVKWVARFAAFTLVHQKGFNIFQLCQANLSWKNLFKTLAETQKRNRKVFHLSAIVLKIALILTELVFKAKGLHGGLKFSKLDKILTRELYLHAQSFETSYEKSDLPSAADFPVFDGM